MLADDHARHRLEDLAGSHDRPCLNLSGRHGAFTRRGGHADQAVLGVFEVGEIFVPGM